VTGQLIWTNASLDVVPEKRRVAESLQVADVLRFIKRAEIRNSSGQTRRRAAASSSSVRLTSTRTANT
jgi:hypothetical protein